jgi:hypothetical protein
MRKIILPLLLAISATTSAQFTYEFTNFNSTNTPVFSGNNFKCVWVGKGNRIWAGTQYQGLYWFDTARKAWTKSAQLTNVFINQIQNDKNGGIWIAQSGTSGVQGGGSNTAGGVNYFPDTTDAGMQFFSTTSHTLSSRNVRGIYLDTVNTASPDTRRIWVPQATFTTSGNTAAGGISKWQYISSGNFQKNYLGLQVFPNTNIISAGTPSCYTACGDKDEVWVGAETNYTIATGSTTQILRYDALTGQHLGGWDQNGAFDGTRLFYNNQPRVYTDNSTAGILQTGFRTTAMYCDIEGRRWIGLRSGGVVVRIGNTWKNVNMPNVITPGAMVNFNAITSDEFGYIYIGTNNGLIVFDNGGDVTDTTSYKRITTSDGLPSNNITGVAYDKAAGRMLITSDAGVTFMKYNYKIKVDMIWDYSFPERKNQPVGVAADGVSRIYLKIKKASDTLPNIKNINLKLKDYTAAAANTRGRLKPALVIDRYSEEASNGTTTEINMSDADLRVGAPGEFWVWYTSPEDFSSDTTGTFATLRKRQDTLTLIVTYLNNKKDTMDYKIAIVRPPTVFVHGLASDPGAWTNTSHNYFGLYVPFLQSPLFTYTNALKMDPRGYFQKNAAQLLGGDISVYANNEDRLNTLQGNIEMMRNRRFASNQVDYVCHSMGGCMIRSAITFYPKKFFAGEGSPYKYKNYGKGFTHKVITLDTPHEGAPVADVGDQFIPIAPAPVNLLLYKLYKGDPLFFGSLLLPIGNDLIPKFKASNAVNNLQATEARGGVRLGRTPAAEYPPIRNHMICGDVNWVGFYEDLKILDGAIGLFYKGMLEAMYAGTYFEADETQFDPATKQATRDTLLKMIAQAPQFMVFNFLNWVNNRRGFYNFLQDSDLIVPINSQTSGQPVNSSNVTVFFNTDTLLPIINTPSPGMNAWHSAIPPRFDVGQRVFQLLNTRRSSNLFTDFFPANSNPVQPELLRPATAGQARPSSVLAVQSFFDTTKIKIDFPARNGTVYSDSSIGIRFRVKDTTRLVYLSVDFQLADSFRVRKTLSQQQISFTVSPSFTGGNVIVAKAVYETADRSGLLYYIDTLTINAVNLAPLQGFRLKSNRALITAGQPYFPQFEARYNNVWVALPNSNPDIVIGIDSPAILSYNATDLLFNGLAEGSAVLKAKFGILEDSALVKVIVPYYNDCVNRTLASGSFKNPATWSKGIVPEICDSVIISGGHNISVDTSVTIRALRISSSAVLSINNSSNTLQLGQGDDAFSMIDNYGTLNISNGNIAVNGKMKHNAASTFTMSNGTVTIDGNKGLREVSLEDGSTLFEAAAGMASFNFSGGTLQINNPPYGAASQAINCPYDFGNNSILILGVNTSATASKNADGFGGLLFPNKIGRLIINAGTGNGNRQFVNKKALTVKGNAEVRTGSNMVLQAPITVNQ